MSAGTRLCAYRPTNRRLSFEIDGAFGRDRFDVRRLADAVEQQPVAVAEAVGVGAADQEVDAGGQVQPRSSGCVVRLLSMNSSLQVLRLL